MSLINKKDKIFVAGHNGMVGNSLVRELKNNNYQNILTVEREELDLSNDLEVKKWFEINKPDIVILAAAKVGGIKANNEYPTDFLFNNLQIQNNVIYRSWENNVKRLLFLGSSCIYPKFASQPIKEDYLLTGSLEPTNEWYAIAKIAGLKLCEAFKKQYDFDTISLMPTNLYGPKDNYDLTQGHVMAALIRKFYEAKVNDDKRVICWGTGNPLREFLYVDDLAEACLYLLKNWYPSKKNSPLDESGNPLNWINIGCNYEISIKDLATKISNILNYKGEIIWDLDKPDGTPRKKLDTTFINKLGWEANTNLDKGIEMTINNYKNQQKSQ